jgi:hypothetical protein
MASGAHEGPARLSWGRIDPPFAALAGALLAAAIDASAVDQTSRLPSRTLARRSTAAAIR